MTKFSEKDIIKYNTLCLEDKKEIIEWMYHDMGMSWAVIADKLDTYPNKIRREAVKLGVKSKDKSEAQKVALATGRHKHPTRNTERDELTKVAISESMSDVWENLSEDEKKRRSRLGKEQWAAMPNNEKIEFRRKAHAAVREAAESGSKLEQYLFKQLVKHGYVVDFHKEHLILNERLHIDLLLPRLRVAVEVDGPSHFKPIWGVKTLERNKKSDIEKDGLLIAKGLVVIRVRQKKALSAKFKRDMLNEVLHTLSKIKNSFPTKGNRRIILGE